MKAPVDVAGAPAYLRLARGLIRRKVPLSYRLMGLYRRLGLLQRIVQYELGPGLEFCVPLYRPCNCWDLTDLEHYDPPTIELLARVVADFPEPVVFVDCGADIGLVTFLTLRETSNVGRVIGIEPNPEAFELLQRNFDGLPLPSRVLNAAVGDYAGTGSLVQPAYGGGPHARYIAPDPAGAIEVIRVDSLDIDAGGCVVLKVDVEGAELEVIRGARATLQASKRFAVDFEAHPLVAARSGVDPIEVFRLIHAIRPCRFTVCERPDVEVRLDAPFFEQLPSHMNYDVIAVSGPA